MDFTRRSLFILGSAVAFSGVGLVTSQSATASEAPSAASDCVVGLGCPLGKG